MDPNVARAPTRAIRAYLPSAMSALGGERLDEFSDAAAKLRTVGLILGPYRNLTTLTASAMSFHPGVQALNHAGRRLLTVRANFLDHFSESRLNTFCQDALRASTGGQRRGYGGSIFLSHGFDRPEIRSMYHDRFGDAVTKEHPDCLFWKESQLVTNRIRTSASKAWNRLAETPRLHAAARSRILAVLLRKRSAPEKIVALVRAAPRLRYVMPVRNPLDCAVSNVRTGHARWIPDADPGDPASVLDRILESIAWFSRLSAQRPDRFFMFFQDDQPDSICDGMLGLLELTDDAEWRSAVHVAFKVRPKRYEHGAELHRVFERSMRTYFSDLPETASRLRALVGVPSDEFRSEGQS